MSEMRGTKDKTRQKQLMEMFEFEPKGYIKKFSKGMKQKAAIVVAFMHDPKVMLLDEPTSGLDPLMQNRFIELVLAFPIIYCKYISVQEEKFIYLKCQEN